MSSRALCGKPSALFKFAGIKLSVRLSLAFGRGRAQCARDMADQDDFAAFMESQAGAVVGRLSRGQKVTGSVTHIGADSVFIALGTRADGRVPRADLVGRDGELRVAIGDQLTATVVSPGDGEGPLLAVTLGRDQSVDLPALQLAMDTGTPVLGRFTKAVKGGLEVDLNGVRAFCPASQVELSYVADLTGFVDQEARFAIAEIRDAGRSVVVSRRRVLEQERKDQALAARNRLSVGAELSGKVARIQPYGAFIDLGGIEGMVHISELSSSHVANISDVLSIGEEVNVKVLAIEDTDRGPRIRLSIRALAPQSEVPEPKVGEVLTAKVARFLPHGVIVSSERGEGFVHKQELGLPHGADHRRALSVDQELEVTLIDGQPGRLRFSATRVDDVRAEQDFANYKKGRASSEGMGSMAAQLEKLKLGKLPPGPPPKPAPPPSAPTATAPKVASTAAKAIETPQSAPPAAEDTSKSSGENPPAIKPRRRRIVSGG